MRCNVVFRAMRRNDISTPHTSSLHSGPRARRGRAWLASVLRELAQAARLECDLGATGTYYDEALLVYTKHSAEARVCEARAFREVPETTQTICC